MSSFGANNKNVASSGESDQLHVKSSADQIDKSSANRPTNVRIIEENALLEAAETRLTEPKFGQPEPVLSKKKS